MRAAVTLLLVAAGGLAGVATAAAPGPPRRGVLVEGKTFGGLPLGLTPAQVRKRWGTGYGICDNCPTPTWYFNFSPYDEHGVGVQFRYGRVEEYFTVGAPAWHTSKGLRINALRTAIPKLYGNAPPVVCEGYQVIQIVTGSNVLFVFLEGDRIWGLGLAARTTNPCR
jgi:hypothetical protein